jgi:hypothetical protein
MLLSDMDIGDIFTHEGRLYLVFGKRMEYVPNYYNECIDMYVCLQLNKNKQILKAQPRSFPISWDGHRKVYDVVDFNLDQAEQFSHFIPEYTTVW